MMEDEVFEAAYVYGDGENVLKGKSKAFAIRIVNLYKTSL